MKHSDIRVFAVFACFLAVGCGNGADERDDGSGDSGCDSDTDADSDSDSDSDTDTDSDTSADTDADTDTDAGSDTDTDMDSDTDTDTDSDMDAGVIDCDGGRLDLEHNLCWQHPETIDFFDWYEAIDYCEVLELAGHTEWRLPSRDEIVELLDNCEDVVLTGGEGWCESCDDSETCFELFGSSSYWYWSSSPFDDDNAWYADFSTGCVRRFSVIYDSRVRCVRPGP